MSYAKWGGATALEEERAQQVEARLEAGAVRKRKQRALDTVPMRQTVMRTKLAAATAHQHVFAGAAPPRAGGGVREGGTCGHAERGVQSTSGSCDLSCFGLTRCEERAPPGGEGGLLTLSPSLGIERVVARHQRRPSLSGDGSLRDGWCARCGCRRRAHLLRWS